MRRRNEIMDKLRVKILQDRKDGLTYEEIQRKRGVSSRTVANLVKGKDPQRFCQQCGETDPEKLQEHHPDKDNFPTQTVTLCASCHSKITREQQRNRDRENKVESVTQENIASLAIPAPQRVFPTPQPLYARPRPLTPQEKRWIGKGALYGGEGIALGEALFNSKLPGWGRLLLGIGGGVSLYAGGKVGRAG